MRPEEVRESLGKFYNATMDNSEASRATESRDDVSDRLTIRRLLLITAGVAVGLTLFAPRVEEDSFGDAEYWRAMANAVIIGLAIPAPGFCHLRATRYRHLGAGGFFALAVGLGVWLLVPAAAMEWLGRHGTSSNRNMAAGCLYMVLPLAGLWNLLATLAAAWAAGREVLPLSWTEKYGLFLSAALSPLGIWQLVEVYLDVLR